MAIKKVTVKRNKTASIAKIVEATAQLFAEKGYENTTYTEIAKRANLNISLISRYFGTKDNLLFSAVEFMTENTRNSINLMPLKPTLEEEIYALADTIVDKVINESNKMKAICSTASYNDEFKKKLYNHTIMPDFMSERILNFYPQASADIKQEMRTFIEAIHNTTYSITYFMFVIFGVESEKIKSLVKYIIRNMTNGLKYSGMFLEPAAEK